MPAQRDEIARAVLRRFFEADAERSPHRARLRRPAPRRRRVAHASSASSPRGWPAPPVMMVALARPELFVRAPGWCEGAADHHARRAPAARQPGHGAAAARPAPQGRAVCPGDLIDDAVEMTGGNPFFLEQLVRALLGPGASSRPRAHWRIDPEPRAPERAADHRRGGHGGAHRRARGARARPAREGRDLRQRLLAGALVALVAPAARDSARSELAATTCAAEIDAAARRAWSSATTSCACRDSSIPGETEVVFKHNLERELIVGSTEPEPARALPPVGRAVARGQAVASAPTSSSSSSRASTSAAATRRRAARCYLQARRPARAPATPPTRRARSTSTASSCSATTTRRRGSRRCTTSATCSSRPARTDEALRALRRDAAPRLAARQPAQGGRGVQPARRAASAGSASTTRRWSTCGARTSCSSARDDRAASPSTLDDMGRVHWLRGAFGQALDLHRQALTIRRALGDRRSIALSLAQHRARPPRHRATSRRRSTQFREALDLRRDIGDTSAWCSRCATSAACTPRTATTSARSSCSARRARLAHEIGDKLALGRRAVAGRARSKLAMGAAAEAAIAREQAAKELARRARRSRRARGRRHQRLARVQLQVGNARGRRVERRRGRGRRGGRLACTSGAASREGEVAAALGTRRAAEERLPSERLLEILARGQRRTSSSSRAPTRGSRSCSRSTGAARPRPQKLRRARGGHRLKRPRGAAAAASRSDRSCGLDGADAAPRLAPRPRDVVGCADGCARRGTRRTWSGARCATSCSAARPADCDVATSAHARGR